MKKITLYILSIFSFLFILGQTANAVDCWPNWDGTWTVEATCSYPGNYKVYGDITVGDKTITLPTGRIIGTDLGTKKITFTTGKINFEGTSKINDTISTRFYRSFAYNSTSNTLCPSGTEAMNTSHTDIHGIGYTSVATTGTLYCAKINSLGKNCQEVRDNGNTIDGRYRINPRGDDIKMKVYCDMIGIEGWTRYLKIKGNYSFQDAKDCWNGSKYNGQLECFNPNKFNMTISNKIMAKRGGSTYYFTPGVKTPSITYQTISNSWRCKGGSDYMVAMKSGSYPDSTASDATYIWLGLNFCRYSRELGGRGGSFMNYSSDSTMGPLPGDRESGYRATEIYIR